MGPGFRRGDSHPGPSSMPVVPADGVEEERIAPDFRFGKASFAREAGPSHAIGRRSCSSDAGSVGGGAFTEPVACCHTTPIGNLGIRTQATREVVDTGYLDGPGALVTTTPGDGAGEGVKGRRRRWHHRRGSLDGVGEACLEATPRRASDHGGRERALEFEPEGAADEPASSGAMMDDEEGDLPVLGDPGEPDDDAAREWCRVVEDDELEGAAAQEDVGAPGALPVGGRTHDPEAAGRGERGPVGRGEGPCGVDVCYRLFVLDRGGDHGAGERGRAAAGDAGDLGEAPARDPPARERRIQRGDPGPDRPLHHRGGGHDRGELGAKGGEGHGTGRIEFTATSTADLPMAEPYSGTIHGPGTAGPPPPSPPRGIFVRTGNATRMGITMGSTLAIVISWSQHQSILWAIIHGILSWVYVIYYALTRG